jgi:hypothetical protein
VRHPMEKTVYPYPLHPECPTWRLATPGGLLRQGRRRRRRERRRADIPHAGDLRRPSRTVGGHPAHLRRRGRHYHRAGHRPVRHHRVVRRDEPAP